MKPHIILPCTILAAALQLALHAASVPITWEVRPNNPAPVQFSRYHGETLALSCTLAGFDGDLSAQGDVRLWFQTNGMGRLWWSAPATAASNRIEAVFGAAEDVGADRVSLFLGSPSNVYASAVLRLMPSPGFTPADLSLPVLRLDFDALAVTNAPYYTKAETDAKIVELSPPPGDYANVSNKAVNSVQLVGDVDGARSAITLGSRDGGMPVGRASIAALSGGGATGTASLSVGFQTVASNNATVAFGQATAALGIRSMAQGNVTLAAGSNSHAEGQETSTFGTGTHAEGRSVVAYGNYSHAEGYNTETRGSYSHAEGQYTSTFGTGAHAEGYGTAAHGSYSHAEGYGTAAYGSYSHTEGFKTVALSNAPNAHALGVYSVASNRSAFVWNGCVFDTGLDGARAPYVSHGEGTFNIRPYPSSYHDAYGVFIGEDRLPTTIIQLFMSTYQNNYVQEFSNANDYAVGDYVTRNGYMYKFISPHPAGEWNSSHIRWYTPNGYLRDFEAGIIGGIPPAVSNVVTKAYVEGLGIESGIQEESDPVWAAEKANYATHGDATSAAMRAVSAFAATGTVGRALGYGTAERWTDEEGVVRHVTHTQAVSIVSMHYGGNNDYDYAYTNVAVATEYMDGYGSDFVGGGFSLHYTGYDFWEISTPSFIQGELAEPGGQPLDSAVVSFEYFTSDYLATEWIVQATRVDMPVTNIVGRVALTNDIPRASGGGGQQWTVSTQDCDFVEFVTNGMAHVRWWNSNTTYISDMGAWPDGASMMVRFAKQHPITSWSVAPNIHLVGYGTWPTNNFQSVWWRSGTNIYVNILLEE